MRKKRIRGRSVKSGLYRVSGENTLGSDLQFFALGPEPEPGLCEGITPWPGVLVVCLSTMLNKKEPSSEIMITWIKLFMGMDTFYSETLENKTFYL